MENHIDKRLDIEMESDFSTYMQLPGGKCRSSNGGLKHNKLALGILEVYIGYQGISWVVLQPSTPFGFLRVLVVSSIMAVSWNELSSMCYVRGPKVPSQPQGV